MSDCNGKTGDLVGTDLANAPGAQTTLGLGIGSDPAWQPIQLPH
jgi:hypothetical protein